MTGKDKVRLALPEPSGEMRAFAAQLMRETNEVIAEWLADEEQPNEPLNRADLGAREVRFCLTDWGDWSVTVLVEEASPDCLVFQQFVGEGLRKRGFGLRVWCVTEW